MKRTNFKKIIAFLLATMLLTMSLCINVSAYGIGGQTVSENGVAQYNIYLWNLCDQDNNEYSLYSEYTQYAACDYTAAVIVGWMYGYDTSSGRWYETEAISNVETYYNNYKEFTYRHDNALSRDGSFACANTEETGIVPVTAKARVYLGYYSASSGNGYSYTYRITSSTRTYLKIVDQYQIEKSWNFG